MQLVAVESGDEKMPVIDQDRLDAGGGKVGGEFRFPDSFGEPRARRLDTEAALDRVPHPAHLLDPVHPRERRQDGLVETGRAATPACPTARARKPVEVRRLVRLQPLQQRPREVQHGRKEVGSLQLVEQRAIHVVEVLREDAIEVADGLVQVQPDDEAKRRHRVSVERERAGTREGGLDGRKGIREEVVPLADLLGQLLRRGQGRLRAGRSDATRRSASSQCWLKRRIGVVR